ncbi:MAG: hypothetical protein R6V41_07695 [Desulfobacteraceae bacterium]
MAEKIDVDKLKNDAFMAIDALFGDEDDSGDSSSATDSEQAGDFDPLEEYMLALDWEYSDKDITAFTNHLDTIAAKYSDRYSQALIKLIKSITNYLYKAKDKAFPETLNVMAHLVKSLVKVNTANLDKIAAKAEVSAAYRKVSSLQKKIQDYNNEFGFRRTGEFAQEQSQTDIKEAEPQQADEDIEHSKEEDIEIISSPQPIEAEEKEDEEEYQDADEYTDELEDFASDLSEPDDSDFALEPVTDAEPAMEKELEEDRYEETGIRENHIIARLEDCEKRIAFLEQQNSRLRRIISEDYHHKDNTFEPQGSSFEEPAPAESESALDFGTPGTDVEPLTAEDIQYEDKIDWETSNDEDFTGDLGEETPDEIPLFTEEESFPSSMGEADEPEAFDEIEKEDYVEYVRFFKINGQTVAIPNSYINNVYKLPAGVAKHIHEKKSLTLGDLASFSQKLSKNMKGGLQEMSSKELKNLEAEIQILTGEDTKYNYGVLCSCEDTRIIVPVSDQHGSRLTLITELAKIGNEYSDYTAEVEGVGNTPLIFPC